MSEILDRIANPLTDVWASLMGAQDVRIVMARERLDLVRVDAYRLDAQFDARATADERRREAKGQQRADTQTARVKSLREKYDPKKTDALFDLILDEMLRRGES
jgi:hypothetical protein